VEFITSDATIEPSGETLGHSIKVSYNFSRLRTIGWNFQGLNCTLIQILDLIVFLSNYSNIFSSSPIYRSLSFDRSSFNLMISSFSRATLAVGRGRILDSIVFSIVLSNSNVELRVMSIRQINKTLLAKEEWA
jgi:hypothetical protein